MNTGDWLEVAALLREVADAIDIEAADGLNVRHFDAEPSTARRRLTIRRRRGGNGLSFRFTEVNPRQTIHITLTTDPH